MPSPSLEELYATTLELKNSFNSSLSELLTEIHERSLTYRTYNNAVSSLAALTTEFESFLTTASSDEVYISKTHAADILVSIENILSICAESWQAFEAASQLLNAPLALPTGNYLFTSQAILKTHKKHKAKEIEEKYTDLRLPTSGFNYNKPLKFNQMKIHLPQTIAGTISILIGTYISFFIGLQTGAQYYVFRILIALGAGLLISGLTKDFIKTRFNINGTIITATGALATFFILYFLNPAPAPLYTPDSQTSSTAVTQSTPAPKANN
ncbi:hypothetical protein QLG06_04925 [Pseudomonas sp. V104_6]|uniref:hypothetical protein n=1 Tax=Pseudomonas sp. V104_6 TaxID=3044230 RepID=UPI00249DA278|nr:hypothetical protein [Pseudomonas sp. V104_6]MDI3373697.1 hypothetical protein [Pseudomonas sp. V104_6]